MNISKFVASVQYDDWKGGAAADSADENGPMEWLEAKDLINENEFLLGITMYAGENHGVHEDPVSVEFLLATPRKHDEIKAKINSDAGPINVRKVRIELDIIDFFGLFKRFDIKLSSHGMLKDLEYSSFD